MTSQGLGFRIRDSKSRMTSHHTQRPRTDKKFESLRSVTSDLPAFLQAQLQLSAEGGGVTADYLALTLSAYLASCKVEYGFGVWGLGVGVWGLGRSVS